MNAATRTFGIVLTCVAAALALPLAAEEQAPATAVVAPAPKPLEVLLSHPVRRAGAAAALDVTRTSRDAQVTLAQPVAPAATQGERVTAKETLRDTVAAHAAGGDSPQGANGTPVSAEALSRDAPAQH